MILFGLGLSFVLLGGLAGFGFGRHPAIADRLSKWGMVGGCLLALVPGIATLVGIPDSTISSAAPILAPGNAPFGIDLLSAWFLLIVLGVGAATSAFGVPYLRREGTHRNVGHAHLLLSVLIIALSGVVTARTIVSFLVCWEIMALAAYFLVIFNHEDPAVWRAGMVYLVLTHVCTLVLIGMFAAWSGGRAGWRFEDLAQAASGTRVPSSLVLTLGLIGFGIKAGAIPFHFWLPGAHAAAPSHVSALLSGIMLKVGIYGLFRTIALLGPPPAWWGWTVLLLGLASSILGVLWALAQHDIKRLLAYHSVENIGIILLGLGLGVLGTAYHQPTVALLGFAGALLHTLNHALFKSLLFLGAGVVVHETGIRDIDRLGGLAHWMPRTALAFLLGSIAIVGLPPLNGFVSEWMIFRGLLSTGPAGGHIRIAAIAAAGLALTGALALACFSKLYGIVFLGTPRDSSLVSHRPEESELAWPQGILAVCCVVIGVAPMLVVPAATRTAELVVPELRGATGAVETVGAAFSISALSVGILALGALIWLGRRMTLAGRLRASAATWGCAYARASSRMQYTASSYAGALLGSFGPVTGIREQRTPGAFRTHPAELVLDLLGRPLWNRLVAAATHLRPLQSGSVRWYLLYAIFCLLGLLLYLRFQVAL